MVVKHVSINSDYVVISAALVCVLDTVFHTQRLTYWLILSCHLQLPTSNTLSNWRNSCQV